MFETPFPVSTMSIWKIWKNVGLQMKIRKNLSDNIKMEPLSMKYRYNRPLSDPFYFYRDSKGNEIDVIYEIGGLPFPIEIKAGSTLNSDFFSSLRYFLKDISGPNPYTVPHALLIYAGDREETRNNIRITTPVHLSRTLSEIEK